MAKLFAQEVPEIYDGIVEVKAVARDPGSRAKIAVISRDSSVDPVGACVGMRGSRVQAVVNELQGEKIDIIPWSQDIATFVVNALAPAEVAKVVLDEDRQRIEVVVPDQQLSLAIGRRGQNVRLASQLTGWDIDILTEQEESERRQAEFEKRTKVFMEALNVDEVVGQLLASEGFTSVEELAFVELKELARSRASTRTPRSELQTRAQDYLAQIEAELDAKRTELGVEDALQGGAGRHHRDAGQARRERREDGRGSGRLRDRRSRRLDRAQGRRDQARGRLPRWVRTVARGMRGDHHAGPPQGRLDHRGRSRAARNRRERRPKRPRPPNEPEPIANRCWRTPTLTTRGPREARGATERTCVVTRAVKPVDELIRFVIAPDGAVVPDLKRRLPGRGVWVTATRAAVDEAVKRKAFARGFKREVRARARSRRARSSGCWSAPRSMRSASSTRPAGSRPALPRPKPRSPTIRWRRSCRPPTGPRTGRARSRPPWPGAKWTKIAGEIPIIAAFTTAQLDLALGRSNVVHAALLAGPASNGFLARCQSLERFRTIDPDGRGTGSAWLKFGDCDAQSRVRTDWTVNGY